MYSLRKEYQIAVRWDNKTVYGFVVEPTEHEQQLAKAVNALPCIYRKIVILFAFEKIDRELIAALLRISPCKIRFLITYSALLLRKHLVGISHEYTQDIALNKIFANWPWMEYSELVKLRKNMVVFELVK